MFYVVKSLSKSNKTPPEIIAKEGYSRVHAVLLQKATKLHDATYIEKKEEVDCTGNYALKIDENHLRVYFASYFYFTGWSFEPVCDYYVVKHVSDDEVEMQTIEEVCQELKRLSRTPPASPRLP